MEQKTTLSGLWSFLDSGKVLPHCSGLYLLHLEDIILPNRLNKYTVFPQKGGKKSKAWWDLQHKLSNKNPMLNVSLGFQSPVHPTSLRSEGGARSLNPNQIPRSQCYNSGISCNCFAWYSNFGTNTLGDRPGKGTYERQDEDFKAQDTGETEEGKSSSSVYSKSSPFLLFLNQHLFSPCF